LNKLDNFSIKNKIINLFEKLNTYDINILKTVTEKYNNLVQDINK
jgi:hypothetical protein